MVGCKGLLPLRVALSSPEAPEALDGADLRQRKKNRRWRETNGMILTR